MLKLGKIYMLECMTETVKCCKIYIIRQIIPNIDNAFTEETMSNTKRELLWRLNVPALLTSEISRSYQRVPETEQWACEVFWARRRHRRRLWGRKEAAKQAQPCRAWSSRTKAVGDEMTSVQARPIADGSTHSAVHPHTRHISKTYISHTYTHTHTLNNNNNNNNIIVIIIIIFI